MPLRADNPGKNYGIAGDFSKSSSSVLKGVRGGSEYIQRSVISTLNHHYIGKSDALSGQAYRNMTIAFSFKTTNTENSTINIDHNHTVYCEAGTPGNILVQLFNGSNLQIIKAETTNFNVNESFHTILLSFDLDNQEKYFFVDGIDFSSEFPVFITSKGGVEFNGITKICYEANTTSSGLYVSAGCIDFSKEKNRNLFINKLGYPKDLSPYISSGDIPKPAFYLKFDDPDDLGLDSSGNNNHFTVNGTVTQGADFHV